MVLLRRNGGHLDFLDLLMIGSWRRWRFPFEIAQKKNL